MHEEDSPVIISGRELVRSDLVDRDAVVALDLSAKSTTCSLCMSFMILSPAAAISRQPAAVSAA
jgi:hypothetical protein